jgi:glycosyltransferase involved in cell wall biosynthesis
MLYPNSIFLALTTDVGKMQELLDNEGFTKADYIVMQVSSEDVPRYLGAADLGLLLREDNPVNAVASPVKFAEYLACGVPVLVTSFVGDYSALVVSEKLGAVVDTTLSDADLADLLEAKLSQLFDVDVRSRCRAFVEDRLSWPTLKQVSDPAKN